MENIRINEEIHALKNLNEEYERQLKLIRFEMCDLPDDCAVILNKLVDLKVSTNLHDLDQCQLEEFYYTKKKEQIDNFLITSKMSSEIKELEEQIEKETNEYNDLCKFMTDVKKRLLSDAEMEKNKIIIKSKAADLAKKQESCSKHADVNLDDLMGKIEILEKRKAKSQKEK